MQYVIGKMGEQGINYINISGKTTIPDIIKLVLNSAELLMNKRSTKILVNITEEEGKFNMMETLELIKKYPQHLRKYKFAIVDRQENYEKLLTHQSMALKRGFRMFGFTDEESAINWLNSSMYNEKQPCTTRLCGIPNCTEAPD
jgi:hypothetical protein